MDDTTTPAIRKAFNSDDLNVIDIESASKLHPGTYRAVIGIEIRGEPVHMLGRSHRAPTSASATRN
jgi:hypothetical protein